LKKKERKAFGFVYSGYDLKCFPIVIRYSAG